MKFLSIIIVIYGITASAAPLDPVSYLFKVSERLTGAWPTPEVVHEFQKEMEKTGCSTVLCLESYFRQYIHSQLMSSAFVSEATLKVFEKFNFQTPKAPPFPLLSHDYEYANEDINQMARLIVYQVVNNNLSIDEIFTTQSNWMRDFIDNPFQGTAYEDAVKFQVTTKEPPASTLIDSTAHTAFNGHKIMQVDFSGHPNMSGLFSTKKFLDRYWNTPVNKNRKRAAALYKIMLCDPMFPALERDTQKDREKALALGITEQKVNQRTFDEIHKNRHANQNDCAKCHTRLDPVARTMRPLEIGVSNFAVPGYLSVFDGVGRSVKIQADNFHDLVLKATKTEAYSNCQLNWLFNWIVGKDVKLHPQRFEELLNVFEAKKRSIRSVITELLLSPEFRNEQKNYEEPTTFSAARKVLENCSECHSSFFSMRGSELKMKLYKISGKLDLLHNGEGRKMPPTNHWWTPDTSEISVVKKWILEGAPLVIGQPPLLDSSEVKTIIQQTTGDK